MFQCTPSYFLFRVKTFMPTVHDNKCFPSLSPLSILCQWGLFALGPSLVHVHVHVRINFRNHPMSKSLTGKWALSAPFSPQINVRWMSFSPSSPSIFINLFSGFSDSFNHLSRNLPPFYLHRPFPIRVPITTYSPRPHNFHPLWSYIFEVLGPPSTASDSIRSLLWCWSIRCGHVVRSHAHSLVSTQDSRFLRRN